MIYDENELWVVCNILVSDEDYPEYFEVKWAGEAIRIFAGETAILPRYRADHFAKHLVDHILTKQKKMVHDEALREPLINQILLKKADETDRSYSSGDSGIGQPEETTSVTSIGSDQSDSKGEDIDLSGGEKGSGVGEPEQSNKGSQSIPVHSAGLDTHFTVDVEKARGNGNQRNQTKNSQTGK